LIIFFIGDDMKIINSLEEIYFDLALVVNKMVLEDKGITYSVYNEVRDEILKKWKV